MWPQDLEAWLQELANDISGFLGQDEWMVRNRLRGYPPLYDFHNPVPAYDETGWIAREAATRARWLVTGGRTHPPYTGYYATIPGYVRDVRELRLWLANMGYRQALRLILTPERIEFQLSQLPEDQRRLLQWRYRDPWTDAELAVALRFTLTPGQPVTPAEVRQRSTEAYRAFCARLRNAFPVGGQAVASYFPLFPGGAP